MLTQTQLAKRLGSRSLYGIGQPVRGRRLRVERPAARPKKTFQTAPERQRQALKAGSHSSAIQRLQPSNSGFAEQAPTQLTN